MGIFLETERLRLRRATADDAPLGTLEEAELSYRLQRPAWGKGYATEIARELVRRGFEELGLTRVAATELAANQASIRVMEKAGLRFEEHYSCKYADPKTGRTTDHPAVRYALNKAA